MDKLKRGLQNGASDEGTVHDTFVLERRYPAAPVQVFAAFSDPDLKRVWYAEGAHELLAFESDLCVGGIERVRYRLTDGPMAGEVVESEGRHEVIVSNRRVVIAATMSLGGRPISTAVATFELLPDGAGTRLVFTHQAVFYEGADGPQMRRTGWETLLDRLGGIFVPA
ncbi:SRPBCC domain-containing protein [Phenylobacterium sp.]|uniref:SRPBCC domain-containing protein n=1 Tax=Phenylobacterium sp. TaxID=1871053 RepID=UPI0035B4669D